MKYYFLGIKGSGMSALAMIMHAQGNQISGADTLEYIFTQAKLDQANIKIEDISKINQIETDVLVVGNSFKNSEIFENVQLIGNPQIIDYVDLVAEQARKYESFAIAGSHGKTTTTGLLKTAFKNQSISYLIGDGNGDSCDSPEIFIFEACEYKSHFLNYHVDYAIINNIDFDHPDYFESIESVIEEFEKFSKNVKNLIVNIDDKNIAKANFHSSKIITFGRSAKAMYRVSNITSTNKGIKYQLNFANQEKVVELPFFGEHMVYNSLAVIATSVEKGYDIEEIINNLKTFKGVNRRFTEYEINEDLIVIDDYAHHPLEIEKTIQAAKQKYPNYKIIAVHQPHTFSRTTALLNEFANSFQEASLTYLLPIWGSVREKSEDNTISIKDLIALTKNGKAFDFESLMNDSKKQPTVILLMSAANIQYLIKDIENYFLQAVIKKLKFKALKELSKSRFEHTVRVAKEVEKMAKIYDFNVNEVLTAAYAHDLFKELDKEKQFKHIVKNYPELKNEIHLIYHGYIAADYLKEKFKITNKNILDAVKYHTTGKKAMSIEAKILFIADYIEEGRKPKLREPIEKLVYETKNLDSAVLEILKNTVYYLNYLKQPIAKESKEAAKYYEKQIK